MRSVSPLTRSVVTVTLPVGSAESWTVKEASPSSGTARLSGLTSSAGLLPEVTVMPTGDETVVSPPSSVARAVIE